MAIAARLAKPMNLRATVIANCYATELFELIEEALNAVALLVKCGVPFARNAASPNDTVAGRLYPWVSGNQMTASGFAASVSSLQGKSISGRLS